MVQTPFYPRESWQPAPQEGRYGLPMRPASLHSRDLAVGQALRECAGIPVKEFALFAVLDNGQQKLYSSTKDVHFESDAKQVWNELSRITSRPDSARSFSGHEGTWSTAKEVDSETSFDDRQPARGDNRRRRHPQRQAKSEESDDEGSARKKRSRPSRRRCSDDGPLTMITATKTQQLRIGDEEEVLKFYLGRFKDMQQNACKIMGKAFVKLVEPKKQTHHPYTKGDVNAPDWWPPSNGYGGPVRHKEPDHLLKAERVCLLAWVVKLVVTPNEKQLECMKHLHINVKKLEETTMEAMKNWFEDKEHPENAEKKIYLKEIFKIAKQEERYNAGQIDGTTYCNVMFAGGGPLVDESSEDEVELLKDEAEERDVPRNISPIPPPSNELCGPLVPYVKPDSDTASVFSSSSRRSSSLRYAASTQPHEDQQVGYPESSSSMYPRGMGIGFRPTSHNDPAERRFGPPVYQSSQPPLYPTAWNSPPSSSGMVAMSSGPLPSPPAYYTTSPQPSAISGPPPLGGPYHLPALVGPPGSQQGMLPPLAPNPFELPSSRPPFEMRTGSVPSHHPPHPFPEFMAVPSNYPPPPPPPSESEDGHGPHGPPHGPHGPHGPHALPLPLPLPLPCQHPEEQR